jgi:Protein of unknown function (DUF4229)
MNPMVKFTLGRIGLFVLVALLLWPVPIDLLLKLMIAIIGSFALQFVVLRKWRQDMIGQVDQVANRRREEKAKLRAALAGEDDEKS